MSSVTELSKLDLRPLGRLPTELGPPTRCQGGQSRSGVPRLDAETRLLLGMADEEIAQANVRARSPIGATIPRIAFEIVRLRLLDAGATELLLGAKIRAADHAERLGIIGEWVESAHPREFAVDRAARLGSLPHDAYAHTKNALLAEVIERVWAETAAEAEQAASVWMTAESRAARSAQRSKLGLD